MSLMFRIQTVSYESPQRKSITCQSCSIMSDSLWVHGFWPARLLCPWDSPGKNTRVGCHCLLQGIFPTQGSNPSPLCILHYRQVLYQWDTWEAPIPVRATFFDPRQKFLNNVTLSFSCLQLINDNFLKREHFLGFIKTHKEEKLRIIYLCVHYFLR